MNNPRSNLVCRVVYKRYKLYKRLSLSVRNMMLAAFLINKEIQKKYCLP